MRAHAPLRPTTELTKAVEPLPLISDSSDPTFQTYEYKVISKPYPPSSAKPANVRRESPYNTAPATPTTPQSPRIKTSSPSTPSTPSHRERRIDLDLSDKKRYLEYLEAKLANTKRNIDKLDTSIAKLRQESGSNSTSLEIEKLKTSIETYKSEKDKSNKKCLVFDRHIKAQSITVTSTQLDDITNKLNITNSSIAKLQSLYTHLRSQQTFLLSLNNSITAVTSPQSSSIEIIQRLLTLIRRQAALSLSFNHEDFKSKLQRVIQSQHPFEMNIYSLEERLKDSRESIRQLQIDWKELQPVLQLKRDVKKMLNVYYNSRYI